MQLSVKDMVPILRIAPFGKLFVTLFRVSIEFLFRPAQGLFSRVLFPVQDLPKPSDCRRRETGEDSEENIQVLATWDTGLLQITPSS